jgi:hypothetical protein
MSFSKKIYRLLTLDFSIKLLGRLLVQNKYFDLKTLLWLRSNRLNKITQRDLVIKSKSHNTQKNTAKKLVLICMTRDEESLLHRWLSHHSKIDEVCAIVIIDHMSSVPLNENLFQGLSDKNFYLYKFQNVNYFQAHVLNNVACELFSEYPESIFLPLDTDEFLPSSVAKSIVGNQDGIGYLNWRMVWPAQIFDLMIGSEDNQILDRYCVLKSDFHGNKHFMNGNRIKNSYRWHQGAHQVFNRFGIPQNSKKIGHLIHLPVRSAAQVISKFSSRERSHVDRALNLDNGTLGSHWNINVELLSFPEKLVIDSIQKYLPPGVDFSDQMILSWEEIFNSK